ncbi:GyrI-like domain-containing protein [Flavobacterium psychrophilum]|uniref:GyrI-like domain-containing protein n=1 Tax=Flavobacterium psychrophilum TaxID=96345 RepID=UPI0004F660BE|nr:GyrI-like domain-containing protein [Flavobacterium psychrophilum]AIN74004.1 AraC family transcriptional regulator [Flavobacterium psychrophilum FPG3]EKT2069527.1 GyrI-like domain-containing protein [Flavobacterium psychrophilum]EKT2071790.1 GyrI-like domain-containing protein [Flavobacterium psychrophilum]EKT4491311.1 GyrI-like domain-containing protein [Flavobacterium psychrophilum]ELM3644867.1 GyrI-like domain-containing protein [Flavobacterium psychrophilum]
MLENPKIVTFPKKKLIGNKLEMSFANDKTFQLWSNFMPRHGAIINRIGTYKFSLQNYSDNFQSNPTIPFYKWALIEVSDYNHIPEGMETYSINEGLFAVFKYNGPSNNAFPIFEYIFNTWLPNSLYELDNREHFEILNENYNPQGNADEEIYIPIRLK